MSCKQSILQIREGFVEILVKEILSVHFIQRYPSSIYDFVAVDLGMIFILFSPI